MPVMTEDSQIYKQNVPANFIIAADQIALDGTNFIQVSDYKKYEFCFLLNSSSSYSVFKIKFVMLLG